VGPSSGAVLPGRCFETSSARRTPRREDADVTVRIQALSVDTTDPAPIARWWADALGWRITFESDDEWVIEPPAGSPEDGVAPDIVFLKVPETKRVKNRLHLDLRPDDQAAELARLLELGASRVDVGQSGDESWVVLADPDGNEFCILRALTPDELGQQDELSRDRLGQ
jgi:hypothetical protein